MLRFLKIVVATGALGLVLVLAVSGPGSRFGFWDYSTGFSIMRAVSLPLIIAAVLSGFGFFAALLSARDLAPLMLVATVSAAVAAAIPIKLGDMVSSNPFIHDITTDFENPPQIVAAADLSRKNPPEYVGDEPAPRSEVTVAEAQRSAFPNVKPITVDRNVEETAALVRETLKAMSMTVLDEGDDQGDWVIEATFTSFWYGFVDDFIVRLTADDGQTIVDVRSKSRVGGSDLGANGRRVEKFLSKLEEAAA